MRRVVAATPEAGEPYLQLAFLLAQRGQQEGVQNAEIEPLLEAALQRGMKLEQAKSISQLSPYISQAHLAEVAANQGGKRGRYYFKRVIAPWGEP